MTNTEKIPTYPLPFDRFNRKKPLHSRLKSRCKTHRRTRVLNQSLTIGPTLQVAEMMTDDLPGFGSL